MPPLLDRLRRSLAGSQLTTLESQVTDLQGIAARLAEAYTAGSYELPPTELVRQLREYDTSLISDLVDQMGWEAVSGYGGYSEGERQRAVSDSTRMAKYSTLAKWTINLWTFYGLSSNVDIVPDDDSRDAEDEHSAQSVWTEFWDADRNQAVIAKDRLDELSRWLLIKGERFFAFYASRIDGETTIRSIRPEEITEIYTNPDDSSDIWFYKRQWTDATGKMRTLIYPDWEIFFSDKLSQYWTLTQSTYSTARGLDLASKAQTDVCLLFVPFTQLDEDSVRGWPLLAPHGTAWLRAQRDFMQDRAAVTRSVAAFVRRYKVSGGTRAVDSIRSTLMSALQSGSTTESNYPPTAGSSEILNRAIDAQDLPLQTGAIDAKTDSEMFSWIALLAGGVFPHYGGLGDSYRLATASSMEKPMQLQFSLYRNQLGAMFRKIVRIVLQFHERYNKQIRYDTYTASISLDRLVEVDLPVISSALTQINDSIIQPLIESNSLTQGARNTILASMLRLVFQSLGMEDASEIVNETIFTKPEEQIAPKPESSEAEPEGAEEPEETEQAEVDNPPTEQPTITDKDIENWLAWVEDLDPDLMELVLADEEEMREYDPSQPRMPAGSPTGGQWTTGGGGSMPTGSWTTPWGTEYTTEQLLNAKDYDSLMGMVQSINVDLDTAMSIAAEYLKRHPKEQKTEQEPKPQPEWHPKSSTPIGDAEKVLSELPDDAKNPWAARFTNNWPADKNRGYSYADWGLSPYSKRADAEVDWPDTKIVYDRQMGGYMPVLEGLSSFSSQNALEAYQNLTGWAKSKGSSDDIAFAYKYMVVYKSRHLGIGTDGEDLTEPVAKGKSYIFSLSAADK